MRPYGQNGAKKLDDKYIMYAICCCDCEGKPRDQVNTL